MALCRFERIALPAALSGGFAGARSATRGATPRSPPRGTQPSTGPGLYDSQYEHDACGVGFVADLSGRKTHHTVAQALTVLRNLDHRGAKGSDPDTGDGAGILTQMPDALFRASCGFDLPAAGSYAAGLVFLPTDAARVRAGAGGGRRTGRARRDWPSSAGGMSRTTPRTAARARGPRCRAWPSCSSPH